MLPRDLFNTVVSERFIGSKEEAGMKSPENRATITITAATIARAIRVFAPLPILTLLCRY